MTTALPDAAPSPRTEAITLAGGCFWCLEAVFDRVDGVLDVESGYSNGQVVRPSYEQVCTGRTGHAEVVRVVFDPQRIPLRELLEIFFVIHDPTTYHRQGNDVGPQYRSGIYFHDDGQQVVIREVLADIAASGVYDAPLVTEVLPVDNYWPAEAYHQDYFLNHPDQGYCAFVVAPKVEKFRKTFAHRVRQG